MKRQRAQDLRVAVDRLPLSTRHAMLEGINRKPIIVGADGNLGGGVCPMLAASATSQKSVGKPFARAWDRYAGVKFSRRATERELLTLRTMLVASIEAQSPTTVDLREGAELARMVATQHRAEPAVAKPAVAEPAVPPPPFVQPAAARSEADVDLAAAIAEHEATKQRNEAARRSVAEPEPRRERVDTGERDRTEEFSGRHGWAWLRPFKSIDDYERVLEELREEAESRLAAGSHEQDREFAGRN